MSDKKNIVIKPRAGLCNRLRFMFSFIKKLQDNNEFDNTNLTVLWEPDNECPYFYLDMMCPIPNVKFVKYGKKVAKIDYSSCGPVGGYKDINYISNVKFSPNLAILNKIKKIINTLENNYIAIHVRRTDHIGLAKSKNRFTTDKEFVHFIEVNKNKRNIFLATDCLKTQQKFKKLYPKKTKYINFINENKKGKRKTSFETAIIDMFVCAFALKFKGSDYSSYSDFINLIRIQNNITNDNNTTSPLTVLDKYIENY